MGNSSKTSVVDAELKVHGIRRLRVVDAGVMPSHISAHTNAATIMIAEKISDRIKADYLPKEQETSLYCYHDLTLLTQNLSNCRTEI